MSRKAGLAIFIIIIFLPLAVYFFLRQGEHHFRRLQIVGEPRAVTHANGGVDSVWPTVFEAYPDFRFVTQRGDTLTWDSLRGKIFITDVFFTRCKGICPKLSLAMQDLFQSLKQYPELRFLSISVDPEHDSVSVLKAYAEQYGADPSRWYFITGPKQELYQLANKAFFFKALEGDGGELGFIHDEKLMLVDKEGRLRKDEKSLSFLNGTMPSDVKLMKEWVKVLIYEYRTEK